MQAESDRFDAGALVGGEDGPGAEGVCSGVSGYDFLKEGDQIFCLVRQGDCITLVLTGGNRVVLFRDDGGSRDGVPVEGK